MISFLKSIKEIVVFFLGIVAFLFIKSKSDKNKNKRIEEKKSENNVLTAKNEVIKENITRVDGEIAVSTKNITQLKKEIAEVEEEESEDNSDFFKKRGF